MKSHDILRAAVFFVLLLIYNGFEFPEYLAGNVKYLGMALLSLLLMLVFSYLCFEPVYLQWVRHFWRDREKVARRFFVFVMVGVASVTHFNQILLNHRFYLQGRIISLPLGVRNLVLWIILTFIALAFLIKVPRTYAPLLTLALVWGISLRVLAFYTVPFNPDAANMMSAIDLASQSLLHGINPYGQTFFANEYNSFPFIYFPLLWLPYLPFKALSLDIRWFNLLAQLSLYLFLWSLIARKNRDFSRNVILMLLMLMPDMVFSFFYRELPHYWLLGVVYIWLVWRKRWNWSLLAVSGLVSMRITALTILWVHLFFVWKQRGLLIAVKHAVVAGTIFVLLLAPFLGVGLERFKFLFFDRFAAEAAIRGWRMPLSGLAIGGVLAWAGLRQLIIPLQVGGLLLIGIIYRLAGDLSFRTFVGVTAFAYAYFLWLSGFMYIYYYMLPILLLITLFFLEPCETEVADLSMVQGELAPLSTEG
jgi:hypothetical protein